MSLQHLLEDSALGPQRVELLQLSPLNEVPPSEPFAYQTERRLADGNAARLDRAIVETGVVMTERGEWLAAEDEHSRAAILEVEHVVVHADRDVAATGAAFIRVDVEVLDEAVGGPCGDRKDDREQRGEGGSSSEAANHYRVL